MRRKFCGGYEENYKGRQSAFVRYGKRGASAHLRCLAVGKGSDFILSLPTWLLKGLPYMQVRELGFEEALREELTKRSFYVGVAAAGWNV